MTTRSTRRPPKPKRASASAPAKAETAGADSAPQEELSETGWRVASLSILVVAVFLRLYHLQLVPLHHDEGVNGNFLVRLVREGFYHYDPANYHGPTLYYFSAIIPWILRILFGPAAASTYGLNTITIRLIPALFGVATIYLVLLLRRQLGSMATLSAAALLAISPGAVYLSRYFIHETLFGFFTVGLVVAGLNYFKDGSPIYLLLASISAALLFATKETAIISVGVLFIASGLTVYYRRLRQRPQSSRSARQELQQAFVAFLRRAGGTRSLALWGASAILVFVAVTVLFYSSFFTNFPQGIYDAFKTFQFWRKTGSEAHVHSYYTYLKWLLNQESPLLFFASLGAAYLVNRPRNSLALFSALWGFGLLAAYSLISYKTPWLTLNFLPPLALVAGYSLQRIYQVFRGDLRFLGLIAFVTLSVNLYQTIDLNFFKYDNDDEYYVYVYAHTRRETLKLVEEIGAQAQRSPEGMSIGITIVLPDYWPLPWYLRDYQHVGYHGRMVDSKEELIIASESQKAEMEAQFGGRYQQIMSGFNPAGSYPLRPGVSLLLYARRDQNATP
ncbi:MAG TPA: flippase activity-associated protein Agl23 [Pyrinomonadaceae bacterium]|nr:flippase activity-associated protein Agl23 [Pyrinomonadaceae bacterium]